MYENNPLKKIKMEQAERTSPLYQRLLKILCKRLFIKLVKLSRLGYSKNFFNFQISVTEDKRNWY